MGSKVYSSSFSTQNSAQPPQPINVNPQQAGDDKKSIMGIKFQVKQFTIQLYQSETALTGSDKSSNNQIARFKVSDVRAFVESRPDSMQANGTLGRLEIYDTSPYAGLYTERFTTSGDQALEFDFFKWSGPLDYLYHVHEYDSSFKLKMSSVKYIHTQRFLTSLTNYFQQFNQLQDALSKMRVMSQLGAAGISCAAQRSSRIKLDVRTEAPIIVLPVTTRLEHVLIFNLGNIEVVNKFREPLADPLEVINEEASSRLVSDPSMNKRPALSHSFSLNESVTVGNTADRECLLDLIDVKFTDTHLYSATRCMIKNEFVKDKINQSEAQDMVKFVTYGFKQKSQSILRQQSDIFFRLERNLENELSHRSPDWYIHSTFSEVSVRADLEQYKLIRGILDRNVGEPIVQSRSLVAAANFIIANAGLETILSGAVWKGVCINFDLENVGIELYNYGLDGVSTESLAFLSFIKSSLIYESFSDGSKLVDLVSNEIILTDTRKCKTGNTTKRANFSRQDSNFYNVLSKKSSLIPDQQAKTSNATKRLQLELHFRSNKDSKRYSVLFNNCRVITIVDWLIEMKNFLSANITDANINPDLADQHSLLNNMTQLQSQQQNRDEPPSQVKLNLTNTDFVLIENVANVSSQAIILRLTAFLEYNPRKIERPVESCLQSFELFSCQMNAIEETALSIIDPATFNIFLKLKSKPDDSVLNETVVHEYLLDISADVFRLRFSYLDFNLFVRVIESVRLQFELEEKKKSMVSADSGGQIMVSTPKQASYLSQLKFETYEEVRTFSKQPVLEKKLTTNRLF
jgi:vacuolar protein sorting-associated protein 13D